MRLEPPGPEPSPFSVLQERAQRAFLAAARFGNPNALDRIRTIAAVFQRPREFFQIRFQMLFEQLNCLMIHARRSAIGFHFRESRMQIAQRAPYPSD